MSRLPARFDDFMSVPPLPIGVIIPTLNCRAGLPAHLEQVHTWAALVQEIVVVDSESRDGTIDYLRENLKHPRATFLQHPPGLYASWNFGVSQLSAKYTYISTVGDAIDAGGLDHLFRAAEALAADVVVSRPRFVNVEGEPLPDYRWPLHHLLASCPLPGPAPIAPWQTFLLNVIDIPQTLLGSSASNLYRTATLQRFPFPTDQGHAGDSAWGVCHALDVVFAATPEVFSRFVLHANEHSGIPEEKIRAILDRFHGTARDTARNVAQRPGTPEPLVRLLPLLCDFLASRRELMDRQLEYYRARKAFFPWFASPRAWRARSERNAIRQTAETLSRQLLDEFPSLELFESTGPHQSAFTEYLRLRLSRL